MLNDAMNYVYQIEVRRTAEKEAIIENIEFRNGILSLGDAPIYNRNFTIPETHAMPIRCVSSTSNQK